MRTMPILCSAVTVSLRASQAKSHSVKHSQMEDAPAAENGSCGKPPGLKFISLPVPNVQALAASSDLTEIPQRYVRSDAAADNILGADDDGIPIIDLGRISDPASFEDEAGKLKIACEDWGFFQVANHGIPDELIEKVKADVEGFFRLPLCDKEAFAQEPGSVEGYGQAFVVSEEQQLDWGDMLLLGTQPQHRRNMKLWPTHPPTFRETMDKYSLEVRRVARRILGFMGMNLGLEDGKLVNLFGERQRARINYYPPCPQYEKVLGISPHSDVGGLTLLLQVNEVHGLQIRRNGRWIPVKPIPGALIVNIGDTLEIYTNGKYKSVEHRAVVDPKKERISIASFHNAMEGQLVGPLSEIVKGDTEVFRTVSSDEIMKLFFSRKLDGKSLLDCLKLDT